MSQFNAPLDRPSRGLAGLAATGLLTASRLPGRAAIARA